MDEALKEKMRIGRAAARALKMAVDAEEVDPNSAYREFIPTTETSEVDTLKAELAALKEKHREKAAHEHDTMSGQEKINDRRVTGASEEIKESLRELLREQLAETFPERDVVRKPARDTARPGAVIATDREGNPVFRKRDAVGDRFAIPDHLKEPGWDLFWARVSVHGWEDVSNQVVHQQNGWRFVPADRPGYDGVFMPRGYKGHIFQDGLALMERPMSLTEEARREASKLVRNQSRAQREQFGMALPDGFTSQTDAAKQFTFARAGRPEPTPSNLKPGLRVDGSMDID